MTTLVTKDDWQVLKSENTKEAGKPLFIIFGKELSSEIAEAVEKYEEEDNGDVVIRVVNEETDADVTAELLTLLDEEDEGNLILVLVEGKKVDAKAFTSEKVFEALIQQYK